MNEWWFKIHRRYNCISVSENITHWLINWTVQMFFKSEMKCEVKWRERKTKQSRKLLKMRKCVNHHHVKSPEGWWWLERFSPSQTWWTWPEKCRRQGKDKTCQQGHGRATAPESRVTQLLLALSVTNTRVTANAAEYCVIDCCIVSHFVVHHSNGYNDPFCDAALPSSGWRPTTSSDTSLRSARGPDCCLLSVLIKAHASSTVIRKITLP